MPERFAAVLQQLRERAHLSQTALASRAGVTLDHIARLERGLVRPTPETLSRLSIALRLETTERDELRAAALHRHNRAGVLVEPAKVVPIRPVVTEIDKDTALRAAFADEPEIPEIAALLRSDELTAGQRAEIRDQVWGIVRAARGDTERSA